MQAPLPIITYMGAHKYVDVQIASPTVYDGPTPNLATLHRVERVLRDAAEAAEPPLSFAEIERRLPVKKIRRSTIKACIQELARFHLVVQGTEGVMWVLTRSDKVWKRPREPLA